MAQVMPGNVGANRVPVGETQNHLKPAVHLFIFENGAVDGVVRDDGAKPGPDAGGDKERQGNPWIGRNRDPLENQQKEIKAHEAQCAPVSLVS